MNATIWFRVSRLVTQTHAIKLLVLLLLSIPFSLSADDSSKDEIQRIANDICSKMSLSQNTGALSADEVFRSVISNYLNQNSGELVEESKITEFWNKNISLMVCTEKTVRHKSPQHILKRVVELDAISKFYLNYFLRYRTRDLNHIEYVDEKPETLLDYLDKILAMPNAYELDNFVEVRSLRKLLQYTNAKHARDL